MAIREVKRQPRIYQQKLERKYYLLQADDKYSEKYFNSLHINDCCTYFGNSLLATKISTKT